MRYERRTRITMLVETPEQALVPCPSAGCPRVITPGWLGSFGGCSRHQQFDKKRRPFDRPSWSQLLRDQKERKGRAIAQDQTQKEN